MPKRQHSRCWNVVAGDSSKVSQQLTSIQQARSGNLGSPNSRQNGRLEPPRDTKIDQKLTKNGPRATLGPRMARESSGSASGGAPGTPRGPSRSAPGRLGTASGASQSGPGAISGRLEATSEHQNASRKRFRPLLADSWLPDTKIDRFFIDFGWIFEPKIEAKIDRS